MAAIAAAVLVIYASLFLATWHRVGSAPLPILFGPDGPDLYLYLNISHLQAAAPSMVMHPRYANSRPNVPGLVLPSEPEWARSNWQSYCVRMPEWSDQRQVMQAMLDMGIAPRRGVMCAHREVPYSSDAVPSWRKCAPVYGNQTGSHNRLRQSELAQDSVIILPLFHQMTEAEQDRVAWSLQQACVAHEKTTLNP